MISKAAIRQAEYLCRRQQRIFARIERKCLSYVRVNESILGPFATQMDADKLFLMLVRSELDHSLDDINAQHSQEAWISASTSEANKWRH
jgi:hypothetical protein